jgi:hypothetical protein
LDIKGIRYVDVLAFTSRLEQAAEEGLLEFINEETEKIKDKIEDWNRQVYESNFARNFKILFVRCKDFYEGETDEERRKLTRLNTSITRLNSEDIDSEVLEPLTLMVKDAQKNVNELVDISKKLKGLQEEFFTEIKFISDIVGIAMPEPSEIDLLQDPLKLIDGYKKSKGIKTDTSVVNILKNIFENIEPVINKRAGGSEYRNELLDVIRENLNVTREQIRFNDVYKNMEEYMQLLKNTAE